MKAAVYKKYGNPEVVHLLEVAKPQPKENEVLIKVIASTVNRTDSGLRSAEYFISRFWTGFFKPKYQILGSEFSGVIEDTGNKAHIFKKGDHVFGYNDKTFGGHGEYLTIPEEDAIALIPKNISVAEAAAITEGSHYALCNLRAAKISKGQNVLVNGATGAIGSAAVQLLIYYGAKVTAVCNTKNIELVKSLGADNVIDYQKEDFTNLTEKFDFIFDAVGKSSFRKCKPLLTKNGIYISTELGKNAENIFLALITPIFGGRRLLFPIPTINKKDVEFLKNLVEGGNFKPVIDKYYTLEDIVEAYTYVQTGQKTGNVILTITKI